METERLFDELPDNFDLGDLDVDFNVDDVSLDPIRVLPGLYRGILISMYTRTGRNKETNEPWANTSLGFLPTHRMDSTEDLPNDPDPVYYPTQNQRPLWHPTDETREMSKDDKRRWKQLFTALKFKKNGYKMFKELAKNFNYNSDNPIAVVAEIGLKNGENYVKRWGSPAE